MKKLTKKQAAAFSNVIKAIEKAHKTGIVFFGKQWDLVAFTKESAIYEQDNDLLDRRGKGDNYIEYFSANVLWDSGADDYAKYKSNSDDPYKGDVQLTPNTYNYNRNS